MKNLYLIALSITTIISLHAADNRRVIGALELGSLKEAETIFEHGDIDINAADHYFQHTLLHYAAWQGHASLTEKLILRGADINAKCRLLNNTPLHMAVSRNHLDVAKILLQRGANKDDKNRSSKTPADLARENDRHDIAQFLDNYDDGRDIKEPDQES